MIRLLVLVLVLIGCGVYVSRMIRKRRSERLAQARAAFLARVNAPREHRPTFKEAVLRNGAVRMRLPAHWAEEYPDEDHASFHDPGNPQRVLRVKSAAVAAPDGLRSLLQGHAGREATTIEDLPGGCLILRSVDASRGDGQDLVVFRWLLASPLPPSGARLATFTLSLPEKTVFDPLAQNVVAMLDSEIISAGIN